ncbi:MAG: hypothetical protein WC216_02775 [Gallionella sp.]|jgi:hypothetical protein
MIKRLADVIYWLAGAGAIALLIFDIDDFRSRATAAAIVFITGWALRYILTGNKSLKP